MNAASNEFIRAFFDPVARLMHISRMESSGPAARRAGAIRMHRTIMEAIAGRDSAAAPQMYASTWTRSWSGLSEAANG